MRITTQAWETYIRRLAQLNEKAAQLMAEYLAAHGIADTEALTDYAAALVQKYGEGSAELACHMVRRVLGDGAAAQLYPMGATQGSASAMGYTQSWTMSGGSSGELYLSKLEKRLLGLGSRVGAHSPLEDLT